MVDDILLKSPFRVLVVEDDRIHYHFEKTILEQVFGDRLDTTWAQNAETASDFLLREQFDICLMDYLLGDTEARDLMMEVDVEHLDTPVIIVSAFEEKDFDVNILQYGAEDYLVKGKFNAETLESAVRHSIYRKSRTKILRSGALRDPLTGLANRTLFDDRLKKIEQSARRDKTIFAVMLLEINDVDKTIDLHGHNTGNELRKHIGKCIKKTLRESDTVARVGGDEFMIIATNLRQKDDARQLANKVIAKISRPVTLCDTKVMPSVNMGISFYPDSASDLSLLVRKADYAMYEAKKKGGGLY